jgi:hypothetical protein
MMRVKNSDLTALGIIGVGAIRVIDTATEAEPVLSGLDQLQIEAAFVVIRQDAEGRWGETYSKEQVNKTGNREAVGGKQKLRGNAMIAVI